MKSSLSLAPIMDTSSLGPLHTHIGNFAETLAKQGYSSYTIDQKHLRNFIYAKVDLAALRALAQPWPGGAA